MATPSSVFAWSIPGTEELQSVGLQSQTRLKRLGTQAARASSGHANPQGTAERPCLCRPQGPLRNGARLGSYRPGHVTWAHPRREGLCLRGAQVGLATHLLDPPSS